MTEEELEKEAEEYADTVKCEWENETYWVDCRDEVMDAYIAGAEPREKRIEELEKKNKKLKDTLAVGSTWNKHLNAQNKALEADRDKYRNMVFDKIEQLDKAKEIIKDLLDDLIAIDGEETKELEVVKRAEQLLKEE